ncbi:MAG: DNA/RNA nuclease SfsA [Firmicutes bacterium]|nr:DNA/RNA nuclease SfsA [Bacillota bacterium]NBI63874.1 DNA/RNA nuclease SfsA [Clostridiales bacterium]
MEYKKIQKGIFIERPNRFVARVNIEGTEETVHVKNTGRCKELLVPGAEVYLEDFIGRMENRKNRYSLVGVKKGELMINMDSQAPNQVVKEALAEGKLRLPGMEQLILVKGEQKYGDSRLDFYVEDQKGQTGLAEVKGVTLEESGIVRFPDAPTQRGVKHIEELIKAQSQGYLTWIIFVIQMKGISFFEPNDATHPEFGDALRKAAASGVELLAYDCHVTENSMALADPVEIRLEKQSGR